ncbi:MAG TPA: GNAT family N-acetyltransferase [Candidatus Ozemobacteraceae bacterium]|nr:GNAT family N-acetyltransferase [Candidatus Ozemobacteraceae bacterium]
MRTLRPFRPGDMELLLRWRNSDEHRRWSFTDRPIDPAEHAAWFNRFLGDSRRVGFIMEDATDGPVGQIRFDPAPLPGTLTVSIGIAPEHLGKGIGTLLLGKAVERSEVIERAVLIRAETFLDNLASRRIFEKAGFRSLGDRVRGDRRYFEWVKPVGVGLSGCACRILSDSGCEEAVTMRRILASLGCSEKTAGDAGLVTIRLDDDFRTGEAARDPDAEAVYVIPARGIGIISKTILVSELPVDAASFGGPAIDRAVLLTAWIAHRRRTA